MPSQRHAAELAGWVWDRRGDWIAPSISVPEAIATAEARGEYPCVLADQGDNTGGGAPGDATHVLRLFMERRMRHAVVLYIVDPDTARLAAEAGAGATVAAAVGGRSHPKLGPPVKMEHAEVLAVTDGTFTCELATMSCTMTLCWFRYCCSTVVLRALSLVVLALCSHCNCHACLSGWAQLIRRRPNGESVIWPNNVVQIDLSLLLLVGTVCLTWHCIAHCIVVGGAGGESRADGIAPAGWGRGGCDQVGVSVQYPSLLLCL
eukprot:SAG22_NODE_304_length_12712_cov_10.515421_5_plen_262_part_00